MSPIVEAVSAVEAVAVAARQGLSASPKTLSPWLFYNDAGSSLFEQITMLPEYYPTRTEREIFARDGDEIFLEIGSPVTVVELGAGTASKTGVLLSAATRFQQGVLYQPIDISPSALDEACASLQALVPQVAVRPQVANYITDRVRIEREADRTVLALYIGSSIGNFSPEESRGILSNLRSQLRPGDYLLLGTDLAPGPNKPVASLVAAYDDAAGVTAAFNLNVLARLNRELKTEFDLSSFRHEARWNAGESRMEMHLVSTRAQSCGVPRNSAGEAMQVEFACGESIHTENSYKFTLGMVGSLLGDSGFLVARTFHDPECLYAVTLAAAV